MSSFEDVEVDENDSELGRSDILLSPVPVSDEEDGGTSSHPDVEFHEVDIVNPNLKLRMKFANIQLFRKAVKQANIIKGKDLTFKNITLANVFDRNKYATGQSEALYFNSTAHLAAYNSSFKGHQDTLLTKGKNWFYKCYVEGDTDFTP